MKALARRSSVVAVALAVAAGAAACGGERRGGVTVEGTGTGTAGTSGTSTTGTGTTPTRTSGAAVFGVPAGVAAEQRALADEVRHHGGVVTTGEWKIAYIVEEAEGWWAPTGAGYRWRKPAANETNHLEIVPIERATGRIVPDAKIAVDVLDRDGRVVERVRPRFYYAEFFHYADNVAVARRGRYTLRVRIAPPPFRRHGEPEQRPALGRGAVVTIRGVELGRS